MCLDEAMERVDSVVTREAEGIWPQVLEDARHGSLKRRYDGGLAETNDVPLTAASSSALNPPRRKGFGSSARNSTNLGVLVYLDSPNFQKLKIRPI
jgi:hypothetical protein